MSVCPSPPFHPLPHPFPNLGSDVSPSYSTFPGVSSPSRQSPGRLTGEAAHPRGYRARGGAGREPGRSESLPAPSCLRREGEREALGRGLGLGQLAPPRLRLLGVSSPATATGPGRDRTLGQGRPPVFLCPGPLFSSHLSTLGLGAVGREGEECARGEAVHPEGVFKGHLTAQGVGSQPSTREDQTVQFATLTPPGCRGAKSLLEMAGWARWPKGGHSGSLREPRRISRARRSGRGEEQGARRRRAQELSESTSRSFSIGIFGVCRDPRFTSPFPGSSFH